MKLQNRSNSVTIVSSYYEIKSKFNHSRYTSWISNFFKVKCNLVVFTDKQHSQELVALRKNNGNYNLFVVEKEFEELECWKKYSEEWKKHHLIDPEASIHSPELYCIWAQKSFFVEEAIKLNPYRSEYFMWCDIGAFREPGHVSIFNGNFPNFTHFIPEGKVVFSSVERIQDEDKILREDGIIGNFLHLNRLVGGLWIGDAKGCIAFKNSYEKMLQKYFSVNRFAGKDQSVMISTLLENNDLGVVIKPSKNYCYDVWFFFEHLLSGKAKFELDASFPTTSKTINLKEIPVFFICPDHNEKYRERKEHMVELLKNIGFKYISYLKSSSKSYPKCLADAQVRLLDMNKEKYPYIILEDDVEINYTHFTDETFSAFLENFSYPSFADCIYLGISKCGGSEVENKDQGSSTYEPFSDNFVRINNMLSTHAMLFLTEKYASHVADTIENLSIRHGYHTDVAISRIQHLYNVFALKKPFFYQSSRFGNVQHVKDMTLFEI